MNFILIFSFLFTLVHAHPQKECHVLVNKKVYKPDKRLFLFKIYEISFGLPINNTKNVPIGYSVDAECSNSSDLNKSKVQYTFDLKETPVEINLTNCPGIFFIDEFQLNDKFNYLVFKYDFKSNKNLTFDLSAKLTLNRRLGNGCQSNLTFHQKSKNSIFDIDSLLEENYYDIEDPSFSSKLQQFFKILASNRIFLGALIFIIFLLLILLFLVAWCFRRVVLNDAKELEISNRLIRLRSFKNKNNNFVKFSNSQETITDESNKEPEQVNAKTSNETSNDSEKPNSVLPESTSEVNEFQILRQQLMNKLATNGYYENNLNSAFSKNLIFQT